MALILVFCDHKLKSENKMIVLNVLVFSKFKFWREKYSFMYFLGEIESDFCNFRPFSIILKTILNVHISLRFFMCINFYAITTCFQNHRLLTVAIL